MTRARVGQAVIGVGIGLLLVAAAVQGQVVLTADSTSSGVWIAIAGIVALFVGLRVALAGRPTPEAATATATATEAPDASSKAGSNAGSFAVLAAVGVALIVIGWVALPDAGFGITLVLLGWALALPSLIALAGELFAPRRRG